jgi:uracil-DNA glycosylase family 4
VSEFDPDCRACPRLSAHLAAIRERYPGYHARPVAPFGDRRCVLLIVGLAPGLHGANASGRPFTGDFAGILLYRTLHRFGLASAPESVSADDGLRLRHCRITNAVKCLPPENKPLTEEVARCNAYLRAELGGLPDGGVILALGRVAHGAVLRAGSLTQAHYPFSHGAEHRLPSGRRLVDSYHCSRYNTQTGRLTQAMFESVVGRTAELARGGR